VLSRLKDGELARARAGFAIASGNNVVEYFDNLFANDFAKNYAIDGYLRSNHLNSMHQMLISVVQMITGKYTKEADRELLTHMGLAQERFIERLIQHMERYFGFTREQILEKINSKNISSITDLDDPAHMTNKYLNTLSRQTYQDIREREVAERNKIIASITLGAIGTSVAILIFNALQAKKLPKNTSN
jgi:hypothetical protein